MTAFSRWAAALLGAAVLSAAAQTPTFSLEAQRRLSGGSSANLSQDLSRRTALLELGEARLAAGDTEAAQRAFDEAALIVHAADIELGLVRAYMQEGEYRRALAFGAHAAGAHPEFPGGTALYAWLLQLGGQGRFALRALDEALARSPDDPALKQAQAALSSSQLPLGGPMMTPPLRCAPYEYSAQVAPGAIAVGSGILTADGRQALASAAMVAGARHLWVRNGLGQTSGATVIEQFDNGLVLLQLNDQLVPPQSVAAVPGAPYAGSISHWVAFAAADNSLPAWPVLRQGFFTRYTDPQAPRPLGIDAPPGARGGPVFDAAGRLAGLAITTGAGGPDHIVPASKFAGLFSASSTSPPSAAGIPMPIDVIYERALRATLQILVER